MLHLNGLVAREAFFESLKKVLRPGEFQFLMRRIKRQARRARNRQIRHASFPYSSDRQNARYARQLAAGQLRFV
jgi:hypothetical protein